MKLILFKLNKTPILLLFIAFSLFSFKSIESSESIRKFWGSEKNCVTSNGNGGDCCTTTTCYTTNYVFWIETSSKLTSLTVDCSGC